MDPKMESSVRGAANALSSLASGTPDSDDELGELDFDGLEDPTRRFEIRDETGKLWATLVRTPDKDMWFEGPDGSPTLRSVKVVDLPLYGSERLKRLPLETPVVVTEGPKDCEAVWRAGLPAVGTVTGAATVPSAAPLEVLRDRIVVLWPDNDEGGFKHMERLAEALTGVAREIRWLQVPGLERKGGAANVPVEEIARLVNTFAHVTRTRVGSSGAPSVESIGSLSLSRETPTYARAYAHEVSTTRYSNRELAEMRKSVERHFPAPTDSPLRELIAVLDRIQGRVPRQGQVGYLISCYRVHGPATAELLMNLYRERGCVDNLLLALELAPPVWLHNEESPATETAERGYLVDSDHLGPDEDSSL